MQSDEGDLCRPVPALQDYSESMTFHINFGPQEKLNTCGFSSFREVKLTSDKIPSFVSEYTSNYYVFSR